MCNSMALLSSPLQKYLFLEAFFAHASAEISARDQSLTSLQELSTLLDHAMKLQVLSVVLPPLQQGLEGLGCTRGFLVLLLESCCKFALRTGTCLPSWPLNMVFLPQQC